jgi:hypothetical protein
MHTHAERQRIATAGIAARAYVSSRRCVMPAAISASAIWSNPAFLGAKQVDPKTEPPRRDWVSTP